LNALTLAETQQSLALALASIEAGFLATDRNARVTQLNQEAARVLGWTEAEAIGRSYWEVFAREGRPASHLQTNAVDLMLQQGLLVRDQQRVVAVARDGRRTLLHVNAALTHAPGGEVIGMIMVFRDLTGQAEAEALRETTVEVAVQVNGKVRSRVSVAAGADEETHKAAALADPGVKTHMDGKTLVKAIIVPGRLINLVVK